jgi:hypothetical protein
MKFEVLSIVLLENLAFQDLVPKIEKALNLELPYGNYKGRLIATNSTGSLKFSVIDKTDDLGELLCDETHTLELRISFKDSFDYKKVEEELLNKLKEGEISWESGVWTKLNIFSENRFIYPE